MYARTHCSPYAYTTRRARYQRACHAESVCRCERPRPWPCPQPKPIPKLTPAATATATRAHTVTHAHARARTRARTRRFKRPCPRSPAVAATNRGGRSPSARPRAHLRRVPDGGAVARSAHLLVSVVDGGARIEKHLQQLCPTRSRFVQYAAKQQRIPMSRSNNRLRFAFQCVCSPGSVPSDFDRVAKQKK
eukprot:2092273-Pleurochrysis_carterae.AAC.2